MPEAVKCWVETQSLIDVRRIQNSIIDSYRDDFGKYISGSTLNRMQRIFDALPLQVGKKLKYVNLSREEQSKEIIPLIDYLIQAKIVIPIICKRKKYTICGAFIRFQPFHRNGNR